MAEIYHVRKRRGKETQFRYKGQPWSYAKLKRFQSDEKLGDEDMRNLETWAERKYSPLEVDRQN